MGSRLEAEYQALNWTMLLLPAYVTWYREGEQVWPVLINGQSGHVSGVRRASAGKARVLSLALGSGALLLFLTGVLLSVMEITVAPIVALGSVLIALSVLLAVVAPVPAIAVWAYNRRAQAAL